MPKSKQRDNNKKEFTQVRRTGDWSSDSKLCSIINGWWKDPYFRKLNSDSDFIPSRTSLICFGYYVRFRVCDYFVRQLLSCANEPVQIVSLGCGMDTLYFRLLENNGHSILRFYDLDYPTVISKKEEIIYNDPELKELAKIKLFLVPADLRFMDNNVSVQLQGKGFDFNAPTIFYSECVVNYLQYSESDDILRWISDNVPRSIYFAYEQSNPLDSFGRIMTKHFEKNGCPIHSIHSNGTLEAQRLQLQKYKFRHCFAINVWDAFSEILKAGSEPSPFPSGDSFQFDEFEALIATCLHYSVRIGITEDMTSTPPEFLFPFISIEDSPCDYLLSSHVLKVDNDRVFSSKVDLKIAGHTSVVCGNKIYVIGGKNQGSVLQNRITRINCSFSEDGFSVTFEVVAESEYLGRSYSGAVYCADTDRILVMGGRRSPKIPVLDTVQISLVTSPISQTSDNVVTLHELNTNAPFPLWRFAVTTYTNVETGRQNLFLFGGKQTVGGAEPVCGAYVWHRSLDKKGLWRAANGSPTLSNDIPFPRHSHAICACAERGSIFVIGGISANDITLCEDALWEYNYKQSGDCEQQHWTRWRRFEKLGRKVGHKVAWHGNRLHVIGGYGNDRDVGLETFITTIDFDTKTVQEFELELVPPMLFLPFDFSAHVIRPEGQEDEYLVVLGGGGNCFSFGSHYNTDCLFVKLPLTG